MLGLLLAAVLFCFLSAPSAVLADGDFALSDDGTKLIKYNGNDSFVSVPDGVKVVGGGAFTGKKAVNTVYLPDSVTEIEGGAFENCSGLQNVIISGNSRLSVIGAYAFAGCSQLNESFKMGVKNVSKDAFSRKAESTDVKDGSTAEPGSTAKPDSTVKPNRTVKPDPDFETDGTTLTKYKGKESFVSVPDGVQVIRDGAFAENTAVETVYLPDSVTEIQSGAFTNCYSLKNIIISGNSKLAVIQANAFAGCSQLNESFKMGVKKVSEAAFKASEAAPEEPISQAQGEFVRNTKDEEKGVEYSITYTIISPDVVDTDKFYEILEKNTKLKRNNVKNFVEVTAYKGNATELQIPIVVLNNDNGAYYGVVAIGPNVFKNNKTLKTIKSLPNTIQVIEAGAFAYCNAMIDQ